MSESRIVDRVSRITQRRNLPLAILLALFCILGVVHSAAVPLFEAPDELWHFSFIRILATERALPVQPTEGKNMWLRESGQPPLYYILAAPFVAPLDTSDFPGFVRFNAAHPAVTADSTSTTPNVFIHTPHEAFPYRGAVLAVHLVRALTILWGAGTIAGVFLVACEIVPQRPNLALAAAAVAALNPHVIYISSVVNNDATAACLCTLALWLAVRLMREAGFLWRTPVSLGVVLGLALLSKVSALALLPLVGLALGLAWWRDRDGRALLKRGVVVFGLAAAVAGWWYVRNWVLYGDPLAWGVWLADIGVHTIGFDELLRQFGHVGTSFWSPYDGLFPRPVFWALGLLAALAAAGWVRWVIQRKTRGDVNAEGLLLAGAWFVLLFISLVRYMTTTPSAEGRLLFPGIASSSLLLVLGLDGILPRRWMEAAMLTVSAGLLALSVFSPLGAIAPRYAPPLVGLEEAQGVVEAAPFGEADLGATRLLGVTVEPEEVQTGETVGVALYWETLAAPPEDLRVVVRLWTLGGRLVGQRDTPPAGEVYPPDLWQPGDVVRDVHPVPVAAEGPAVCRVEATVMAGQEVLGQASSPAVLKLAGEPILAEQIAHPLDYTLGDRIALVGYDVVGASGSLEVTLYWRASAQIDEDYTVFVHLLGEEGLRLAQGDGPPLNGDYPTSHWSPGEVLADTHLVPWQEALPPDAYLLAGLYRLADGARLPAYAATGERVRDDAIPLLMSRQ